jgi:phage terminase large subunit-like protein
MSDAITLTRTIGKYERLCWERHDRDLALCGADGKQHPRGIYFDAERAERPIQFIERFCRHHKGKWAGQLMVLAEWQRRILRIAFGWMRRNGTRRFRTLYVEIPRKNGKSQLAAALGLYLVLADGEQGAEVYSSATKKDQAKIVFGVASVIVKNSPELGQFIKIYQSSLQVPQTSSFFQPLGADSNTLDGLNPHGNIVDELHAHRDRGVWDVLQSALGAREQPLTIAITTAGKLDETGIGWEQHDYARKVLDGDFEDDSYFAFIAAADEDDKDKWFDVATQMKANPNFGISVGPDYLEERATAARRQTGALHEYLTKHLNIWSQENDRWLQLDKWKAGEEAPAPGVDRRALFTAREQMLRGKPCRAGLDLSSKLDLTAIVLEFLGADGEVFLLPYFWIPEARVKFEADRGRRHYESWARDGWLHTSEGDVIDYTFIRKFVGTLGQLYDIREIGFDPWSAQQMANDLAADGFTMVEFRQTYQYQSEASKDIEALTVQSKVRHSHHPVMTWNVGNAIVVRDANENMRPVKRTQLEKIDGVIAWVMARGRNLVAKEVDDAYRDRGSFLSF